MEEDIKLYKEFLSGNQDSFDSLMEKYRKNIICFINRFVNSIDIAEDLAQDVFVYLLINRKEYDFKYSMKTYLYTIARSRALNYLKREKRLVFLEEDISLENNMIPSIEEEIFSKEKSELIYHAINQLKPKQQKVIYLADIEGMSYREISKILGNTVTQTKMIIYRARKKLKIILREELISNE